MLSTENAGVVQQFRSILLCTALASLKNWRKKESSLSWDMFEVGLGVNNNGGGNQKA